MAEINISPGSWLNLTRLLDFKGLIFWDQTEYPEIPFSTDDTYVQLEQGQATRLDLIAYDFYDDPELMWVIQVANNLDLPNQAREGMVIRIPARETVDGLLRPVE